MPHAHVHVCCANATCQRHLLESKSGLVYLQDEEEVAPASSSRSKELDMEDDDDDDHEYMTEEGDFLCDTVVADGLPKGAGIPTEVCFLNSSEQASIYAQFCHLLARAALIRFSELETKPSPLLVGCVSRSLCCQSLSCLCNVSCVWLLTGLFVMACRMSCLLHCGVNLTFPARGQSCLRT